MKLQQLVAGDLADGSLVNELRLGGVGGDGGNGFDPGAAHDDRVALDVTEAPVVADDNGTKDLLRFVLRNGAGDDAPSGVLAVELDDHVGFGVLMTVGEQTLGDDSLGVLAAHQLRIASGGVDAADLNGFHLDARTLVKIDDRLRIHDVFSFAVALAVMLFGVVDAGVFADMEGVYAVMAAFVAAGVVDAAAGDNVNIAVLADIKVVIDHLRYAGFADDDGNMAGFAPGAVLDADVDALLAVGLWGDLDMLRGLACLAAAVLADVERADGLARKVGDLFQ